MSQKQLFRKKALDKMSSPEELDVMTEVTSPKGWLALYTIGGILLLVVGWSVFGTIPTRVNGEGILIRGGALRQIESPGTGVLTELELKVGDEVEVGQSVASIDQPNLSERVANAETRYRDLQRSYEESRREDGATIRDLRSEIDRTRSLLKTVEEDLASKRESYDKGLITLNRVRQVESRKFELENRLDDLESEIRRVQQSLRRQRLQVEEAKGQWEELESTGDRTSRVTSNVRGRVIEIKKRSGDQVSRGEVVAQLEPLSGSLQPVFLVSSTQGKRVQAGMPAEISPTTVKKEEFGFMRGTVTSVGDYPVTPEAVMGWSGNRSLTNKWLNTGAKIEVRAELKPADTPSGFEWSSSSGPPHRIDGGTEITVSVVVDQRRPISYVLPYVRSVVGAS